MDTIRPLREEDLTKDPVVLGRELLHKYHEHHRSEPSLWDVFLDINKSK